MRKQYKKTLEERREERARKWEEEIVAQGGRELEGEKVEYCVGVL